MYLATVAYTSTGIAFLLFIAIILYHAQRQLFLTKHGTNIKANITLCLRNRKDRILNSNLQQQSGDSAVNLSKKVTYTVVELTEPLLED